MDTSTPFKTHNKKEHVHDISPSPTQSVSPDHTDRASRRYFTPALQQGKFSFLSDLTGRLLDTQGSISTTDTYYTATWGSPYEQRDGSANRHHVFDLSSRYLSRDSPTPGLNFDLGHLVPSRLAPQAPTDSPRTGRHSAPGFVDKPSASAERSIKRKHIRDWVEQGVVSDFIEGEILGWESERIGRGSVDLDSQPTPSAISGLKLAGRGSRLQSIQASPTLERRPRQLINKRSRGLRPIFGETCGDQNSTPQDSNNPPTSSRSAVTTEMLASRWMPTPDKELLARQTERMESVREAEHQPETDAQDQDEQPLTEEAPAAKMNNDLEKSLSPVTLPMDTSSQQAPRQRIKVPWKGRNCMVAMPWQGPEAYGGSRPLSEQEVRDRLQQWADNGFETRGFDLAHLVQDDQPAAQGRPVFPDPTESAQNATSEKLRVSVPDPKAWKHYVDWLTEQKLRALGVSFGDDEPPAATLQPSHQRGRSVSPALAAAFGGPQGLSVAQRSNSGLSNFSGGPHSRTMSIASPMSANFEPRGHMHRHSVFGMPSGLQQPSAPNGGFRSFSPLQQGNFHTGPRSGSPAMHERMKSVSPGIQANYMNQFRPSPVPSGLQAPLQPDRNWTPPAHMRHQSLASSFAPQPPARMTPSQPSLMEVPEDEEDIVDGYLNHTPAPIEEANKEIAVPTPKGHRHNISEVLDRDLRNLEASLEQQFGQGDPHQGNFVQAPPQQAPQQDSFSFRQGFGQQAPLPFSHGFPVEPQPQPFNFGSMQQVPKPAMPSGHRSRLSVAAPEFRFNPGTAFQPSIPPKQIPSAPLPPVHETQSNHTRQQSSGNLNVTAPAFNPTTFGTPTMPSGEFSFAAPIFTPGGSAVQGQNLPTGQHSIFGNVQIPEGASGKKSKAIPIVRPESSKNEKPVEIEAEDEYGRVLQSEERQKRARKEQDDGDSIPLFAERPDSPVHSSPSPSEEEAESQDLSSLVADTVRIGDEEAQLEKTAEQNASANIKSEGDFGTLASIPAQRNHQRNQSSLSAFARPFQPGMATAAESVESSRSASPVQTDQDTLSAGKPNLSPMRIFSRQQEAEQEAEALLADPEKQAPVREKSPYHLAELSFEPSFDEIDAVMRQLNDDDDVRHTPSEESPQARPDAPQYLPPSVEREPSPLKESGRTDVASPDSIRMHAGADRAQSISSLPDELEMPPPSVNMPKGSDEAIASDWSEGAAADETDKVQKRTSFFDDRVDELIGAVMKEHLQPLQDQLARVHRAVGTSTSPRISRPRTSSGIDSDADDEDDIVDSKFLQRPMSRGKDRRLDLIRATVLEALNNHGLTAQPTHSSDLHAALVEMNATIARIAAQSLNSESVKAVLEEALYTHAKAVVHVPVAEDQDVVHSRQLSEMQSRYEDTCQINRGG